MSTGKIVIKKEKDKEGNKTKRINHYEQRGVLGKGSFGEVFLCVDTRESPPNQPQWAMKVLNRPSPLSGDDSIVREITVMKKLRHRNLVTLKEVIDDASNAQIFLVMEFVEHGALMDDVTETNALPIETARKYFRDIICGLAYLHVHGVVHCDLKPQNLFVTREDRIKIADFGSSMFEAGTALLDRNGSSTSLLAAEDNSQAEQHFQGNAAVGTPFFMAPELFKSSDEIPEGVNPAVDIWSLGATLYMMIIGRPPWMGRNEIELSRQIQLNELKFPGKSPTGQDLESGAHLVDPHVKSLIKKMLVKETILRCELHEIFDHDWVTEEGAEPIELQVRCVVCAVTSR